MTHRICTTCNRIHTWRGPRCHPCQQAHDAERNQRRRNGGHTDPAYQRARRRFRDNWLATHRAWCPGDENHGHHPVQPRDLTVDHITPISMGGSLLDPANMRVLCRSANSSKGARMDDVTYRDGTSPLD